MTCHWKALDEGYNFCLDFILIEGLHKKLQFRKVEIFLTLSISGLSFGNPEIKRHLDEGAVERCKVCYMGDGGGFP